MRTIIQILLTLVFCHSHGLLAQIYSWTDKDGNRVYTDQKPTAQGQAAQQPISAPEAVNYYSATKVTQPTTKSEQPVLATLEAISETDAAEQSQEAQADKTLTEQDCRQQYQLSCDQVVNWRQYAREKCGDDQRCQDDDFLDRKYRPRTLAEQQAIARRSAIRNNMRDKKIAQFLTKKYTNYCENQARLYCSNKHSGQCEDIPESFCKDTRSLQDIFARYDNLTVAEKQQIIKKAKQLSVANGKDNQDYAKLLIDIVELLTLKSTLGI